MKEKRKQRLRESFQKGCQALGADAVLYCRQKWAGDEWVRDVGETKTDDSQRDVWRLLAGPGVAACKNAMSTVATAGQRGADWRDATLAGRDGAGAQAIGRGWVAEKK